jgi:hypothetical protein
VYFRDTGGIVQKGKVYPRKRNSSQENDFSAKLLAVCRHPQDDAMTIINTKKGIFSTKGKFSRAVATFRE